MDKVDRGYLQEIGRGCLHTLGSAQPHSPRSVNLEHILSGYSPPPFSSLFVGNRNALWRGLDILKGIHSGCTSAPNNILGGNGAVFGCIGYSYPRTLSAPYIILGRFGAGMYPGIKKSPT